MSFPIKNGGSFHNFLYVYQRVPLWPSDQNHPESVDTLRNVDFEPCPCHTWEIEKKSVPNAQNHLGNCAWETRVVTPWLPPPPDLDIYTEHFWLVVDLPLWKIWVRQLEWWHSQYMEKIKAMFQTTNQYHILIFWSSFQLQFSSVRR